MALVKKLTQKNVLIEFDAWDAGDACVALFFYLMACIHICTEYNPTQEK